MSAKPTELKKLIALLDAEAPDVEWLAKAVWELVEQCQAQRQQYVAIAYHPDLELWQAVGPYPTRDRLLKDYQKRLHAPDPNSKAAIALLRNPATINLDV